MNLNLDQAADFLGVPENKLVRWLRQGVVPSHSGDGAVFFVQEELEHWARKVRLPRTTKRSSEYGHNPVMKALEQGGLYHIQALNRDQALKKAVALIPLPALVDRDSLLKKLIDREAIVSTGMGNGIAVPHPSQPIDMDGQSPLMACFYLDPPIDFSSPDGQPVFCMLMLLCADPTTHLRLLSGLAQCLKHPGFDQYLATRPNLYELARTIGDIP